MAKAQSALVRLNGTGNISVSSWKQGNCAMGSGEGRENGKEKWKASSTMYSANVPEEREWAWSVGLYCRSGEPHGKL